MEEENIFLPIIRHVLTFTGASAVFSGDELTAIAGAIASIASVGWALYNRRKVKKEDKK